jgi:predicted CXXCH cytochrome family protein
MIARRRILFLGLAGIAVSLRLEAQIATSKHNLSVSATAGTIKATVEQEICIFCHIPHKAAPAVPLWDHNLSSVTYTKYTSTTFSATYLAQYPNSASKLCLSCHDGTIAIGATTRGILNVTGGSLLDPDQSLAGTAASNIGGAAGTNLADDHPITITFNTAKNAHYTAIGQADQISCTSCHDPHKEDRDITTKKFLSQSNSGSGLCLKCHTPPYWSTNPSVHQSSTKALPTGWSHNGYGTVAEAGCESCHKPHTATGAARLTKAVEQATCEGCHDGTTNGGITAKNVSAVTVGPFAKPYRHPTYTTDGKHSPVNASPVTNTANENSADVSGANRHAECQDCHNPHAARTGLHTTQSNTISLVLGGVWGNEPAAATNWTQPLTFTRVDPATKEYQICMKCHSSYGLGTLTAGVSTIIGPSAVNITDQAMEYNINNFSVHPVKVGLSSQTGSYAPKPLVAAQMSAPWSTSLGIQTMYCSDCHGNDALVSTTEPGGPHGSNRKFMLRGTTAKPSAQYWPLNAGGTNVWTLRDVSGNTNSWSTNLFCVGCHPLYSGTAWNNNAHTQHSTRNVTIGGKAYVGIPCVSCHVAVPHGSKRSRLIGYKSDVAPYAYFDGTAGNINVILGFKKAATRTGYGTGNCQSTQTGCSGGHNGAVTNPDL